MKYEVLFSLKNNEKVFTNVVCCSRDWRLKGYLHFRFTLLTEYLPSKHRAKILTFGGVSIRTLLLI